MIGGSGNPAHAAPCASPGAAGYDNPASITIQCITATFRSIDGNITNEGTLSENGPATPSILLSHTTLSGFIGNSGTIDTFVQLENHSTVTGGFSNSGTVGGLEVGAGSTLSGGIFNSSTGIMSENGPAIFLNGTVSGGITNAGLISSAGNNAAISASGTFSGGINNSGTITGAVGIVASGVNGVSIFNSGTITGTSGTAILFESGTNTLTLAPGSSINGYVFGTGGDTLQLGGTGNGTFDLSTIGNSFQQYQGFTTFNVVGGNWTVNNTLAQSGAWTVQSGTLLVNGDLSSASGLTVSGGVLGGTGTVGNTQINSGGTFAPGTPGMPGTSMTVSGNLAFQSGALYLVQVNSSSSTMANVTGTASLAGDVLAVIAPGSYVSRQYDILHSAGLNGTTFAALDANAPAGFAASLSYTPTDVFLNLTATLGSGGGLNGNQQNVANGLNNFFNGGGALTPNFAPVFGLSGGSLTGALSQLSGEVATDSEQGAFLLMNQFLGLMVDPFANGRGGPGGGATGFAPEQTSNLPPDIALAYGASGVRPMAATTPRTATRHLAPTI
jgi:hypothetical protein